MTRVLLVGTMGTGKTSVGAALSELTGWPYLDNDVLLERSAGLPAPELLARDGEQALREAEAGALTLVLGLPGPLVAGVAAGVVLSAPDRVRLREGGHVVWLRARPETLARRVGRGAGRPWLGDDPAGTLRTLAAERAPLYAEVAHQVLDVDELSPRAAARLVRDAVLR